MAKSQGESPSKKDLEKKKQQKRKEKEQRKEERRAHAKEGRSFEDMIAYIDENGNITSTPPDPTKKKAINQEDIVIGSRNVGGNDAGPPVARQGRVTFFNTSKGYGFIKDLSTQESIFVHINALGGAPIKENDKVTYDVEHGPKGLNAVRVKVIP
jgi:cold shock CspA family protein